MIKRIVPSVFDTNKVTVFFTESNRENVHTEHIIPGLDLGFNTRSDKKSVGQSYGLLAASLGKKELNVALAKQIHATAILEVKQAGNYPDTDGLITTVPGLGLGIRVADCAAVLVADTEKSVIGAFHAGWRGAAGGIIPKGVGQMTDLGASPGQMKVFISPCISQKNFEVGEEVASLFPPPFCDYSTYEKPHVDLKGYITSQLIQSGISKKNIEVSGECTVADKRFYSYRRERDRAGRMLAFIKLND